MKSTGINARTTPNVAIGQRMGIHNRAIPPRTASKSRGEMTLNSAAAMRATRIMMLIRNGNENGFSSAWPFIERPLEPFDQSKTLWEQNNSLLPAGVTQHGAADLALVSSKNRTDCLSDLRAPGVDRAFATRTNE